MIYQFYLLRRRINAEGRFAAEEIPALPWSRSVLVLSEKDGSLVEQALLYDYIFAWGDNGKKACIALGYFPYNHSYEANCDEMVMMQNDDHYNHQRHQKEEAFINYNAI